MIGRYGSRWGATPLVIMLLFASASISACDATESRQPISRVEFQWQFAVNPIGLVEDPSGGLFVFGSRGQIRDTGPWTKPLVLKIEGGLVSDTIDLADPRFGEVTDAIVGRDHTRVLVARWDANARPNLSVETLDDDGDHAELCSIQDARRGRFVGESPTDAFISVVRDRDELERYDASCSKVWHLVIEDIKVVTDVYAMNDGGYLVAGAQGTGYSSNNIVVRFGSSGDELWRKTYKSSSGRLPRLINARSSSLMVTGAGTESLFITKISLDGQVIWDRELGGKDDWPVTTRYLPNGDFAVGYVHDDDENPIRSYIAVISSEGDIVKQRQFGEGEEEALISALEVIGTGQLHAVGTVGTSGPYWMIERMLVESRLVH